MKYILVVDEGTSHTRAILFDVHGKIKNIASQALTQYYPQPAWVEHCPDEIWEKTKFAIQTACVDITPKDIMSVAITNQRETMLLWDKVTGKCLSKAIVWQDRRTQEFCDELKEHHPWVYQKTGLPIDPYFSASKLTWMIEHHQIKDFKNIAFGTIDSYLIWRLTAGAVHATDITNASRTLLFNIHEHIWDEELLKLFRVPQTILPRVLDCDAYFGNMAADILGYPIPIRGVIGDQQASLVGVGAMNFGQAKMTYGTGGFLVANTGSKICLSGKGLLSTVAYAMKGQVAYALEGNIYDAGSCMNWLKDNLGLIQNFQESQALAESVPSSDGLYFIPAFSGLGAPHWLTTTGASFVGLSRGTQKAHMVRAVMESVAFQTRDILAVMDSEIGQKITKLSVDGGMAENCWFIQFLANLNQIEILIPNTFENTAKGAAWIAGQSFDAVASIENWQLNQTINFQKRNVDIEAAYRGWLSLINSLK
jgi:glycerol kinase